MIPGRRKKWTEAEERTLIDKYGEMVSDGSLSKMKTREKKFRPISLHVNSVHHARDPVAFPWQWSWKDVSTKVQNMRHQYSLVKQKVQRPQREPSSAEAEGFDWGEGLAHWSNFLRYKEVFGDSVVGSGNASAGPNGFVGLDVSELDGDFELGLEYDGDGEESRKRKRRKRKKRKKGTKSGTEGREKSRERRRMEEEEREWEERVRRRRAEWRTRMEETLTRHREEMSQMQARVLQEHQSLTSQLLGIVSQWAPHDHAVGGGGGGNHYFSHMMHGGGLVQDDDTRVEGEDQDGAHHFIVS